MTDHRTKALKIFNDTSLYHAEIIDHHIASKTFRRGDIFLEKLKKYVKFKGKVLDYGSGTGRLSLLLASSGYIVEGKEPAEDLLKSSVDQSFENISLQFSLLTDDGESLNSDYFDAIVCSSVLEFVPDPELVINNFYNSLKPGGFLFISLPNKRSLWRLYSKIRFRNKYKHFTVQQNVWSTLESIRKVQNVGFKIIENPSFFESPFDKYDNVHLLNRFSFVGTLFLLVAKK